MVELDKMNKWIESHIQSVIDNTKGGLNSKQGKIKASGIKGAYRYNYHGLMLPLENGGGDDLDPQIMLSIIPQLNQPFNTKERAPFKIVCETIRYKELQEQEKKMQE